MNIETMGSPPHTWVEGTWQGEHPHLREDIQQLRLSDEHPRSGCCQYIWGVGPTMASECPPGPSSLHRVPEDRIWATEIQPPPPSLKSPPST